MGRGSWSKERWWWHILESLECPSGAETGRTCSTGCEHGDHAVSVFPHLSKGSVSHHVHCYDNDKASAYGVQL